MAVGQNWPRAEIWPCCGGFEKTTWEKVDCFPIGPAHFAIDQLRESEMFGKFFLSFTIQPTLLECFMFDS